MRVKEGYPSPPSALVKRCKPYANEAMPPFLTVLTNRSVIRISGEDRRVFLQGLISNDINLCTPLQPVYAALLTPQGKFLYDLFIVDTGDTFLVDCEAVRAGSLLKRLGMYKLRAMIDLENMPDAYEVWAGSEITIDGASAYMDPRLPSLGMRAIIRKSDSKPPDDFKIYDKLRLSLGVPDGSRDMLVEKSTLLECNLDRLNAISWTKGCYIGQELTARMHYRGLAKKRLFPVEIEGAAPDLGSVIQWSGEDIGDMRSSCETVGLALLNIEKAQKALQEGAFLKCGESRLRVLNSPVTEIKE